MRGEVALDDTPIQTADLRYTADTESYRVLEGATYRDLMMDHPSLASRFGNFVPTVMSVICDDGSAGDIEELMRRLGQGNLSA